MTCAILAVAACLSSGGCALIGPDVPGQWVVDTINTPAAPPPGPRMQILIWYDIIPHTAVLLEEPGKLSVYWDPGGAFGLSDEKWKRRRDLFTDPAPTAEQVWDYWRTAPGLRAIEAFEFDLPAGRVRALQDVLLAGRDRPDALNTFDPQANGSVCCLSVCEFLQRFAPDAVDVPTRYTWPHHLARHLYTQSPSRVVLRQRGRDAVTLVPDSPMRRLANQPVTGK